MNKECINNKKEAWLRMAVFYGICTGCLLGVLYIFVDSIGRTTYLIKDLIVFGSESLLLMSPIWIIGRRWRWTATLVITLVCLFLFANILYFRYWQDLIPLHTIFDHKSYNSLVFANVPDLLQIQDSFFLLAIIVPIAGYRFLHIESIMAFPLKQSILLPLGAIAIYIMAQLLSANALKNYMHSTGEHTYTIRDAIAYKFKVLSTRLASWKSNGLVCYTIGQLLHLPDYNGIRLSAEEENMIKRHIGVNVCTDTICGNKGKNLILIIVESLNADVVNMHVKGRPLTPVLNRLLEAEGTISCLNVISQVKDGGSSDGQMIYNTGLLPIKNGSAAMLFGSNDYPSLISTLKPASSMEIIAENGNIWNHRTTSTSFGYDRLEEEVTRRVSSMAGNTQGNDAAVFRFAVDRIDDMPEPFIMEITTLSMHSPFQDAGAEFAPYLKVINGMPPYMANYYRMTNYFDTQLGIFLDRLKSSGIYDRSVIIIASDHNVPLHGESEIGGAPIVFVALNTGLTKSIDRIVGQIDVFPTIIDIMGGGDWRGVGLSMLLDNNSSAVDATGKLYGHSTPEIDRYKADAWQISDLIIRSNYFARDTD